MRKVKYGRLVDFMPPEYDPFDMIGSHIYASHIEQESLKTSGYNYYVMENGLCRVVEDASFLEKMIARVSFAFRPNKRRIIGERISAKSKENPYNNDDPILGIKQDDNGKKTIDYSYYNSRRNRANENNNSASKNANNKLKEAEEYLNNIQDNSSNSNEKSSSRTR